MTQGKINVPFATLTGILLTLTSPFLLPGTVSASELKNFSQIVGTVRDADGNTLNGASITILKGKSTPDVVGTLKSDARGRFTASILPGLYRLRVELAGFATALAEPTQTEPNRQVVLNFVMRRADHLLRSPDIDPVKYQARKNRTVLDFDDEAKTGERASFFGDSSGAVGLSFQPDSPWNAETHVVLSSSFSQRLAENVELLTASRTDLTDPSPRRLHLQVKAQIDGHMPKLALGWRRLTTVPNSVPTTVGEFTIRATDTWKIGDTLLLVYGFDLARVASFSDTAVQPRIAAEWRATPTTTLFAGWTSDGTTTSEAPVFSETFEPESSARDANVGAPTFADEMSPAALRVNRSRRIEAGISRRFSSDTTVETTLFLDSVSGNGIGLAFLEDAAFPARSFSVLEQQGDNRGFRIVVKRKLTPATTLTAGYAFGRGQTLGDGSAADRVNLQSTRYQVFTARIDTVLLKTGTEISGVFRHATGRPVFAIDPFQGRIPVLDQGFGILITQAVPGSKYLPGKWEIVLEARNLADQSDEYSTSSGMFRVVTTRRTVRGGVGMRF